MKKGEARKIKKRHCFWMAMEVYENTNMRIAKRNRIGYERDQKSNQLKPAIKEVLNNG